MTTATANQTKLNAGNFTADSYMVIYGEHDSGSGSQGFMVREGLEAAQRTERLLDECGYQRIEIKAMTDLLNG